MIEFNDKRFKKLAGLLKEEDEHSYNDDDNSEFYIVSNEDDEWGPYPSYEDARNNIEDAAGWDVAGSYDDEWDFQDSYGVRYKIVSSDEMGEKYEDEWTRNQMSL